MVPTLTILYPRLDVIIIRYFQDTPNNVTKNRRKIISEQNLRYNLTIWNKNDVFDIPNDISENVTLIQLMVSLGNVNHDIIIVGHWIFDHNYKKKLFLTQE